jgi:hypothetical protein
MDEVTHEFDHLGQPDPDYETGPIEGWHSHQHKHPPGSQRDTHLWGGETDGHRHYHTPRDRAFVYDHHPVDPDDDPAAVGHAADPALD